MIQFETWLKEHSFKIISLGCSAKVLDVNRQSSDRAEKNVWGALPNIPAMPDVN